MLVLTILFAVVVSAFDKYVKEPYVPHRAPAYPVMVSSPYMNAWMPGGEHPMNGSLVGQWPVHWNGRELGLTGMLRINTRPYVFMGNPLLEDAVFAKQEQVIVSNTNTTFWLNVAEKFLVSVTFFTPVFPIEKNIPRKYWRASVAHTFFEVKILNVDEKEYNVDLYVEVTANWATGDPTSKMHWETEVTNERYPLPKNHSMWPGNSAFKQRAALIDELQDPPETVGFHRFWREDQQPLNETLDQSEAGSWAFSTGDRVPYTWESGHAVDLREHFIATGSLKDAKDTDFRPVGERQPAFAFARQLGHIWAHHWGWPVDTWSYMLSHHTDITAQFLGTHNETRAIPSMESTVFPTVGDSIFWCWNDRERAKMAANWHDEVVEFDTQSTAGSAYTDVLKFAVRQVFSCLQWAGTTDRALLFFKDFNAHGSIMNKVSLIYPWHVVALYYDTDLLRALIEPIYIQAEKHWPHSYAPPDIGTSWPYATGHPDGVANSMPLEDTVHVMLMSISYYQRSKDKQFVFKHWATMLKWLQYLVNNTLYTGHERSSDDFGSPLVNQTNLALKGIVAIKSFMELAEMTEQATVIEQYAHYPPMYMDTWLKLSFNKSTQFPNVKLAYDQNDTTGMFHAAFADQMLGTALVPSEVVAAQNLFYESLEMYHGLAFDSRGPWARVERTMLIAAIVGQRMRELIFRKMVEYISLCKSHFALSDLYDPRTGQVVEEVEEPLHLHRPVLGGIYAPLAILKDNKRYH